MTLDSLECLLLRLLFLLFDLLNLFLPLLELANPLSILGSLVQQVCRVERDGKTWSRWRYKSRVSLVQRIVILFLHRLDRAVFLLFETCTSSENGPIANRRVEAVSVTSFVPLGWRDFVIYIL